MGASGYLTLVNVRVRGGNSRRRPPPAPDGPDGLSSSARPTRRSRLSRRRERNASLLLPEGGTPACGLPTTLRGHRRSLYWRGGSLGSHAARSARLDHRDPGTGPVWLGKRLPSQDRSIMTESGPAPYRSSRPACFDSSSRGSRQVLAPHTLRDHYPIFTSMVLGLAFSDFGRWTSSTPSLYSATTPLPSASSGIVKLRPKRPYARSTR